MNKLKYEISIFAGKGGVRINRLYELFEILWYTRSEQFLKEIEWLI